MKKIYIKNVLIILLMLITFQSWAQTRTITGKVTDAENGTSLIGVTILEKGTQNGTQTDKDGNYSIKLKNDKGTLVFSLLSYLKKEAIPGKENVLNMELKIDAKKMNEVVVVAYGESTRKELTAAVTTIEAKKLEDIPLVSIDQVLQGQVAGLQVSTYSGQPGGEVQVRLRGVGSITAGSQPLYVVDGIPINTGQLGDKDFQLTWTSNSLAGINANDIENVTVLKDAAATAIYGSRGSNGVIVITTKKGKAGKTQIRFDTDYGVNKIIMNKKTRPLNADEYRSLTYEGLMNAGYSESAAQARLDEMGANNGANTNWLDVVTRNSQQKSYNLSARGGNENTQFYISGGYFKQEGTTLSSDFDRVSTSMNLEQKASEKLNFEASLMLSSTRQHTPYQSGYFRAPIIAGHFLTPFQRPYDSTGAINLNPNEFTDIYNPLAIDSLDKNYLKNLKIIGGVGAYYEIIKGLKLSTKISIDYNNSNEFIYANPFYGDGVGYGGWADQSNTYVSNWVWTSMLDYHKDVMDNKLQFDIKAGFEEQQSTQNNLAAEGQGYPPTSSIYVLSATANPTIARSGISDYAFRSYFSNGSITYKSKYTFSASYRRDGSSRFGQNNQYGNFYSVGASWSMDQEKFIKKINWISTLRVRTSYGQIGNADIGNYSWRPQYEYGSVYNGDNGIAPSTSGNYNLTWEKNNPFDAGFDAGVFNDRLNLIVDFYTRKTTDMLLNVPVSQTTGFSTSLQNVGEMVNRGWEFTISAKPIQTKSINWQIDFNIATNKNTITKLYHGQDILLIPYIYSEGGSYHTFYSRQWAGVDPQTGHALWYTDSTHTETTTDVSKVHRAASGSAEPKWFGGFTNSISYKNFTLSFQINYVFGNKVYDGWAFYLQSDGAYYQFNQTLPAMNHWQKPGDISENPIYIFGNTTSSNYGSTRFLYDGDYMRLRDITLSYNLPTKLVSKMKIGSIRVYVKGTNLYTWLKDKRISFDPDLIDGISDLNLPNTKTFLGGLSVEF